MYETERKYVKLGMKAVAEIKKTHFELKCKWMRTVRPVNVSDLVVFQYYSKKDFKIYIKHILEIQQSTNIKILRSTSNFTVGMIFDILLHFLI